MADRRDSGRRIAFKEGRSSSRMKTFSVRSLVGAVLFCTYVNIFAPVAAAVAGSAAGGGDFDRYAVIIARSPLVGSKKSISGAGIYLGHGAVLTAAHVAGRLSDLRQIFVLIKTRTIPARVVKVGSLDTVDIALLHVDAGDLPTAFSDLPSLPLCVDEPVPGQTVLVIAPGNAKATQIAPTTAIPPNLRSKLPTLIRDVYATGNSGSGVFDPELGCLMGIVSQKIESESLAMEGNLPAIHRQGLAKYFVSASAIRGFLGGEP